MKPFEQKLRGAGEHRRRIISRQPTNRLTQALLGCDDPIPADEIFQTVERAKSRSLLDLVGTSLDEQAPGTGRPTAYEDVLATDLARLHSELNVYYSRLADAAHGEQQGVTPERIRHEIRSRERRLDSVESRLVNARGVAGLFAPPAKLDVIRGRLPNDAVLVEYFTAAPRSRCRSPPARRCSAA